LLQASPVSVVVYLIALFYTVIVKCCTLLAAACSVRLVALDGCTYGVRVGSVRHRLAVNDVSLHFGPAGPAAAEHPQDLRLRYIKVSIAKSRSSA
jgi:hypothetical protein